MLKDRHHAGMLFILLLPQQLHTKPHLPCAELPGYTANYNMTHCQLTTFCLLLLILVPCLRCRHSTTGAAIPCNAVSLQLALLQTVCCGLLQLMLPSTAARLAPNTSSTACWSMSTHVPAPSCWMSLGMPSVKPLAKPGRVCTATCRDKRQQQQHEQPNQSKRIPSLASVKWLHVVQ
jgi:hypothetical protein